MTGKPKSDMYLVGAPSALVAGFFAAACSLPLDMVKTRMQKMRPDAQVQNKSQLRYPELTPLFLLYTCP
jgi:hypothetical protein